MSGHQRVFCPSPGWYVIMAIVVMMPAGDNSLLVYQSSLTILPAETSGASRRNGRSENFAYQFLKYLNLLKPNGTYMYQLL
jgi:hypothetical protein